MKPIEEIGQMARRGLWQPEELIRYTIAEFRKEIVHLIKTWDGGGYGHIVNRVGLIKEIEKIGVENDGNT